MRAADKQHAERQRQAKVLDKAIAQTSLLQEELQPSDFPTSQGKAFYVQQLQHPRAQGAEGEGDQGPALQPATLTLLERVKLRREKVYRERVHGLEVQRQGLVTESKAFDKAQAELENGRKKRLTLSEAIRNDERLAALPPEQVLQEFAQEGKAAHPRTLEQFVAQKDQLSASVRRAKKAAARKDRAEGQQGGVATVPEGGQEGEQEEEEEEDDDDEFWEDEEEGTEVETEAGTEEGADGRSEQSASAAAAGSAGAPAAGPSKTADSILRQLKQLRAVQGQGPPAVTLNKLVRAIKRDIPDQEQELHELKMKQAVVQTRLNWALQRPSTYQGHELPHTAKQRAARAMCKDLAIELVDAAWRQVSLRPSLQQVAAEVAEWKAKQLPALLGIARHLADAVLKDVVDELIAEVSQESNGLHQAADNFAFDILVEAVAYSQGKYDFVHDDVHARLRELTRQEEHQLQSAVSHHQGMELTRAKSRAQMGMSMGTMGAQGMQGMQGSPSTSRRMPNLTADPEEFLKDVKGSKAPPAAAAATQAGAQAAGGSGGSGRFEDGQDLDATPRGLLPGDEGEVELMHNLAGSGPSRATGGGDGGGGGPKTASKRGRQPSGVDSQGADGGQGDNDSQEGDDDEEEDDAEDEDEEDRAVGRTVTFQSAVTDGGDVAFGEQDPFGVLDTTKPLIPQRRIAFGSALPTDDQGRVDERLIYAADRVFDDERMSRSDKQLYMLGLKAMLQEMRKRRGDAPYGHTQALTIAWPRNLRLSRARVLAAQRMRPALTAGPAVWRHWDEHKSKIKFAAKPRNDHMRAAEIERVFWRKVLVRPFFLGEAKVGPLIYVRDKFAPITCISPSPSGHFMAVGTATGATVVFDLRNEPSNPWFEVLGDGEQLQAGGLFSRQRPNKPAIACLTWSMDNYQLASLDATSVLRMFWMRPFPGQDIKENDGPKRQPVLPELAMSMGPMMMAVSGKAPLSEEQLQQREERAAPSPQQQCMTFHRAFNITGTQPSLLLPQVTGDVLRVTSMAGESLLPMPFPRSLVQHKAPLSMQTVNFLMPPQAENDKIRSQSIYRGHNGHIVFLGFLSDNTTVVSVDENGQVNLWPAHESERTGFGWFQPRATWTLPPQLRTWRAWGPVYPLWPRKPQSVGFTLFGWITTKPTEATAAGTFEQYASDQTLHDTPDEMKRLEEFPMANFLLEDRTLWLVRYRFEGKDTKKGRIVREEMHRPSSQGNDSAKPLVVSSFEYPQGTFVRRSKQSLTYAKTEYKVVSACLTHSKRDLLLWCRVAAAGQDPDSFPFFSCHVLNLEAVRPMTPRIDIYDHSNGQAPPAYAVSPTIGALGSEYLFVGMGCGMIGVYSLATGQLVRELSLNLPTAPYMVSLQLFNISPSIQCMNMRKTILAAVPANSAHVHMLEISDELSSLELQGTRRQQQSSAPAPAPAPAPTQPPAPATLPGGGGSEGADAGASAGSGAVGAVSPGLIGAAAAGQQGASGAGLAAAARGPGMPEAARMSSSQPQVPALPPAFKQQSSTGSMPRSGSGSRGQYGEAVVPPGAQQVQGQQDAQTPQQQQQQQQPLLPRIGR